MSNMEIDIIDRLISLAKKYNVKAIYSEDGKPNSELWNRVFKKTPNGGWVLRFKK